MPWSAVLHQVVKHASPFDLTQPYAHVSVAIACNAAVERIEARRDLTHLLHHCSMQAGFKRLLKKGKALPLPLPVPIPVPILPAAQFGKQNNGKQVSRGVDGVGGQACRPGMHMVHGQFLKGLSGLSGQGVLQASQCVEVPPLNAWCAWIPTPWYAACLDCMGGVGMHSQCDCVSPHILCRWTWHFCRSTLPPSASSQTLVASCRVLQA
jgi:hypothetical protein